MMFKKCFQLGFYLFLILSFLFQTSSASFYFQQQLAPNTLIQKPVIRSSHYFIGHDGRQIHYKVKGNPHAKTAIVALHGYAADSSYFLEMLKNVPRLEKDFRIFLITLRGHGMGERKSEINKSIQPSQYYFNISRDMIGILKKHHFDSMILMGHSMGGEIIRYFYEIYPKKAQIKALVLIATFLKFPLSANKKLSQFKVDSFLIHLGKNLNLFPRLRTLLDWLKCKVILPLATTRFSVWIMQKILAKITFKEIDLHDLRHRVLPVALSTSLEAYLMGLQTMGSMQDKTINAPTLIVHGDEDLLALPIEAKMLRRHVAPHAKMHMITGFRHCPHLDTEDFPNILNHFLDNVFIETAV